ncbi:hypothetical protein E2562_000516 [Oryza meyeriana var. granulata]|uniref:Uncharacterized protein n=1 Tax=Oryza meyeriana var. granulata TaxID=110450 RepID=A0A6G1CCE3_9ORYZ|nr:hypothetical protein E2562_000516 [Oryza meyeriana var. granulata]
MAVVEITLEHHEWLDSATTRGTRSDEAGTNLEEHMETRGGNIERACCIGDGNNHREEVQRQS